MTRYDQLHQEYYWPLVASGIRVLGWSSLRSAEEIAEETISFVCSGLDENDNKASVKKEIELFCKNRFGTLLNLKQSNETHDGALLDNLFDEVVMQRSKVEFLLGCCVPEISPRSQVIFILKTICSHSLERISDALDLPEEEIAKSLERTRAKVINARDLPASAINLNILHAAIYAIFMQGYLPTSDDSYSNGQFCVDAMRLIKLVLEASELVDQDTYAIMALMCFFSARFPARVSAQGELVELETYDRSLWDKELISMGIHYLKLAHDTNRTSRYVFEAAIASLHSISEESSSTNWQAIAGLYDRLGELQSNPFTDMKRAEAILHANGPNEALAFIQKSRHGVWLRYCSDYYGLLGAIYSTLGDGIVAIRHYEKALSLTELRAEKEYFSRKISTLQVMMN
jgi:predicted RNA polymerase sigma factor